MFHGKTNCAAGELCPLKHAGGSLRGDAAAPDSSALRTNASILARSRVLHGRLRGWAVVASAALAAWNGSPADASGISAAPSSHAKPPWAPPTAAPSASAVLGGPAAGNPNKLVNMLVAAAWPGRQRTVGTLMILQRERACGGQHVWDLCSGSLSHAARERHLHALLAPCRAGSSSRACGAAEAAVRPPRPAVCKSCKHTGDVSHPTK